MPNQELKDTQLERKRHPIRTQLGIFYKPIEYQRDRKVESSGYMDILDGTSARFILSFPSLIPSESLSRRASHARH